MWEKGRESANHFYLSESIDVSVYPYLAAYPPVSAFLRHPPTDTRLTPAPAAGACQASPDLGWLSPAVLLQVSF